MNAILATIISLLILTGLTGMIIDLNKKEEPVTVPQRVALVATPELNQFTREGLLSGINEKRTQEGLTPLTLNNRLNESAQLKAEDMNKKRYWAHVSPSGEQPWVWFKKVQYFYTRAGENLAKCYSTNAQAVEAWWNSPTHKDNILGDYTEAGFGFVEYEPDCVVIVNHFGRI